MNKKQRIVWTTYLAIFVAVGGLGFMLWHDHQEADAVNCAIALVLCAVTAAILHVLSRPSAD